MDWFDHVTCELIEADLGERRALAARERLAWALRPRRAGLRVAAGHGLMRLGAWVAGRRPRQVTVCDFGH